MLQTVVHIVTTGLRRANQPKDSLRTHSDTRDKHRDAINSKSVYRSECEHYLRPTSSLQSIPRMQIVHFHTGENYAAPRA